MLENKKESLSAKKNISLRLYLDVDIERVGIELGSIPKQLWYGNGYNANSIVWMVIELPFGIIASSSNLIPVWMQKNGIEIWYEIDQRQSSDLGWKFDGGVHGGRSST